MVPVPISAPDAISPAFARARQLLLSPFRWSIWWRLAVIGMVINGEFFGMGIRFTDILRTTRDAGKGSQDFMARGGWPPVFEGMSTARIALLVAVLAALFLLLLLIHIYIGSVLRFVLLDAVATGRYRLREGWRAWRAKGRTLFLFNLLLAVIFIFIVGAIITLMILGLMAAGITKSGGTPGNPALAIASVLLLIPVIFIIAMVAFVVMTIAYDLGIPIMALENISGTAAFSRAWRMVKAAKGEYAAYIGLKLVLMIALGIAMAIVQMMIFLPVIFVAVFIVAAMGIGAPDIFSNPVFLAAIITVALFGFSILSFVMSLIAVPILVIFQAYALIFFAPRYRPLYVWLYGEPPAPPAAPEAPPSIDPGSEPLLPPEPAPAV
jgi:hypothetical protein